MKKRISNCNLHITEGGAEHNSTVAMQGLQRLLREAVEQILLFHIRRFLKLLETKGYTSHKDKNKLLIFK
ncbi:hypothetical protein F070042J6_46090 [Bacteroides sp. f07]